MSSNSFAIPPPVLPFPPKSIITTQLMEKYQELVEHQRKLMDAHRAVWDLEYQQLNQRILALESSIKWYESGNGNPSFNTGNSNIGKGTDEKGPTKGPTKGPPYEIDPVKQAENAANLRMFTNVVFTEEPTTPFVMGTGISVPPNDGSFEGILFKEPIRAPPIAESFRPLHLQTPAHGTQVSGPRPVLGSPIEFHTKDAGRTPSMKQVLYDVECSATSSSLVTPTQMAPRGDVELKAPLGLKNNNAEDRVFLRELDTKLQEAVNSRVSPEPGKPEKENVSREPEQQPKPDANPSTDPDLDHLPLKPSLNFGSPFGASYCGKGV